MQFCCGSVVLVQLSSITGCSATGGPNWRLAFSDPVLIAAERTARQNFLGIWGNGGFPTGRRR
jgi:endonuclease YncB( thermonuclease family)